MLPLLRSTVIEPRISFLCMTRADRVNAKIVATLRALGCGLMAIGVETGDADLAKQPWVGRARPEHGEIRRATVVIRQGGIHCRWYLQVGMGQQDWASIEKTIRFYFGIEDHERLTIDSIRSAMLGVRRNWIPDSINVATNIPYPGTVIERFYRDRVWVKPEYRDSYERMRHEPEIGFRDKIFADPITETEVMSSADIGEAREITLKLHSFGVDHKWEEVSWLISRLSSHVET